MTTAAEEIADDWQDFDGLETVTLRQIRPDGTNPVSMTYTDGDGETQPAALRRQVTQREFMALGGLAISGKLVAFELPASVVGTDGVVQGDQIIDEENVIWQVQQADKATLGTRWRCLCTR